MSAAPAYLMHTSARQPDSFSRGLERGKAAQLFSPATMRPRSAVTRWRAAWAAQCSTSCSAITSRLLSPAA